MKENFELHKELKISNKEKEIEKAKNVFEKLAQRLGELWQKDKLTPEEEKEVELILNNALVIEEIIEGKMPQELK